MSHEAPRMMAQPVRTSQCTCLRLRKITRQVTQIYDQRLAAHGLTVTQYSLLGHLRALPGIGIGALAEAMIMDPTALTRTLRPLERQGLVTMRPDAEDRRARRLHLTEAGETLYVTAHPAWRTAQDQIEHVLSSSGQPALNGLLDDLIQRFQALPAAAAANDMP